MERQSCGGLLLEILLQDISVLCTLRSEVPMGRFLSSQENVRLALDQTSESDLVAALAQLIRAQDASPSSSTLVHCGLRFGARHRFPFSLEFREISAPAWTG